MLKNRVSKIIIVIIFQISLFFYLLNYLESQIILELNPEDVILDVSMSKDEYNNFIEYVDSENIKVKFETVKNGKLMQYTNKEDITGCEEINHYGSSNKLNVCSLDKNTISNINIKYTNGDDMSHIYKYLNSNNIKYGEYQITTQSSLFIQTIFIMSVVIIFLLVVYLMSASRLKDIVVRAINGWSKTNIVINRSLCFIIPMLLSFIILSLFELVYIKANYSHLSYNVFLSKIIPIYILINAIMCILIIFIHSISIKLDIVSTMKNHKKFYHNIVIGYFVKSVLNLTTLIILGLCIVQTNNVIIDINNLKEYEKFNGYNAYQVSDSELHELLTKSNDYVYYTSFAPSEYDEEIVDICSNEYNNIMYCKSIAGSSEFFKIATGKEFTKNTIVIPYKYKDQENQILDHIKTEFETEEFSVEYIEDTKIYSYDNKYSNKSKDFIEDAVWIVYDTYESGLHNVNTVYTNKDMSSTQYNMYGEFADDYKYIIKDAKTSITIFLFIAFFQIIFFIYVNSVIIKAVVNNNLKKFLVQITSGYSYLDIFYLHYTHTIVMTFLSGAFVVLLLRNLIPIHITIIISIIILLFDIVLNHIKIRKILGDGIVRYLKGDVL